MTDPLTQVDKRVLCNNVWALAHVCKTTCLDLYRCVPCSPTQVDLNVNLEASWLRAMHCAALVRIRLSGRRFQAKTTRQRLTLPVSRGNAVFLEMRSTRA